jgi:hypothetical protein
MDFLASILLSETFLFVFLASIFAAAVLSSFLDKPVDWANWHQATLKLAFVVLIVPTILSIAIIVMIAMTIGLGQLLLPHNFWIALALMSFGWIYAKNRGSRIGEELARSLFPWLISMWAVAVIFLAASNFIAKANWVWLFRVEDGMSFVHSALIAVLPESVFVKLLLMIVIFLLNFTLPQLRRWTSRFEISLRHLKTASKVLTIVTSLTVFGESQLGEIGQVISTEKQVRVEQDTVAIAELAIGARLTTLQELEMLNALAWLEAVDAGVRANLAIPPRLEDYAPYVHQKMKVKIKIETPAGDLYFPSFDTKEFEIERKRKFIKERIAELKEAVRTSSFVTNTVGSVDSKLRILLGRKMTLRELAEAKSTFEKALKLFIGNGTKLGEHPINGLLKEAEMPELGRDLVVEFYKSETKRFAKSITEPFVDATFRADSPLVATALQRLPEMASKPIFEIDKLPREILRPTVTELSIKRYEKIMIDKTIKETVRRVK